MILVTGASGFVGRALVARLTVEKLPLRECVRPSGVTRRETLDRVEVCELNRSSDWRAPLLNVSTVIHCAARVHVMNEKSTDPLQAFRDVNVDGTANLARQAAAAGVKRFVFISSIKVNGEATTEGKPFTELDPALPEDPYGISKMEAEAALREISLETGMELVIIRPPLVYGPGVKANFAALMRAVKKGIPLPLGLVHNRRSLVALDNLVDFIVTCVSHPKAANEVFLVSDGQDVSTTRLVREMAKAAGVSPRLLPLPAPLLRACGALIGKGDAVQRLCGNLQIDVTKARTLLGWQPPVSIEEGIRRAMLAPLRSQ
jgi:nucleoside-diphosphate-sugar epimerase